MNKEALYKISGYDYILAGIILIVSVAALVPFKIHGTEKKKVEIFRNNVLLKEIDLPVPGIEHFVLQGSDIEIEVKNESVRVAKVSCPLKVCKHEGWISSPTRVIVCVPNKLLIKIVNVSGDVSCHAVSY